MREILSANNIKLHMNHDVPIHVFESIGSTNSFAVELAGQGAIHGTTIFARSQTAGRGRLGRTFASPDSGIYMSIIMESADQNPVLFTTAAAVAVCRAIENICDQKPGIKWVNDIYIHGKKACGILAEAVTDHKSGQITHIVVGIGINCRSDAIPPELTDIAGAVEGDYSINHLAAETVNQLLNLTSDLSNSQFISEYKSRSIVLGKNITVYKGGFTPDKPGIPARVLDIDNNGGLKVIYTDGSRETLSTGEISIRLQPSGESDYE